MRFLAMIGLAGCAVVTGQPPPAHTTEADPPMFAVPGEAMEYRVLMRGMVVGQVRVAIGQPGEFEGKRSIVVRSRGDSGGVVAIIGKLGYELTTTIDLERGLPIVSDDDGWAELAGKSKRTQHRERWHEFDAHHDIHSAVGRFRGWRSQPGERIAFELHIAGAQLDIEAWHAEREYMPAAHAYAIRYDGKIEDKFTFRAWVSDDPSRVPLRLEASSKWGMLVGELLGYTAPPEL